MALWSPDGTIDPIDHELLRRRVAELIAENDRLREQLEAYRAEAREQETGRQQSEGQC